MMPVFLSIESIDRLQAAGELESLSFELGVNVLVGVPNTGKTKWLQLLDYLLGDPGNNPFEGAVETGLAGKYVSAGANLRIGEALYRVERRWQESGAKTKVFVEGKMIEPQRIPRMVASAAWNSTATFPARQSNVRSDLARAQLPHAASTYL